MISEKVLQLCTSENNISSELAKTPGKTPGEIAKHLYSSSNLHVPEAPAPKERKPAASDELERARQCGKFGNTQPSELFLRAFNDVLHTLEHDALADIVSPSLIGTTGYVPFAVIGPLNDIVRHMSNLITRAKKEVLLATNYWMASGASRMITDALIELSKRAGERGEKVQVRIMYDRGNIKQFMDNHQPVSVSEYTGNVIKLPSPEQAPNLDLRVVNYHRPLVGTFHAKFMIVDRTIGMTQSNNIQDNDNVEMMTQLEGPIVDSLWETFIISWHNAISPLPCINERAADKTPPTFQEESFKNLLTPEGLFRLPETKPSDSSLLEHVGGDPHYDVDVAGEVMRMHSVLSPSNATETQPQIVARHLNKPTGVKLEATAPAPTSSSLQFFPFIPMPSTPMAVPMALCSRKPYGPPTHTTLHVPQNEAFLSLILHAKRSIFIQTPDLNASPLIPAIIAAARRGVEVTYYVCLGYNDAGELLPMQGGTNEMIASKLLSELEKHGEEARSRLKVHYYVAKDQILPIHNQFKQRSCHVKLLIADESVAVQGSGNQDTQSWWQSQEVNVMIDSPIVCKSFREGIERNQNTGTYGAAARDGCWRDADGNEAKGALGVDPGRFAWAKGIVGAYKRAKGAGGF